MSPQRGGGGGAAGDAAPAGGQVPPGGRGPVPTEEAGALVLRRCRLLRDPRVLRKAQPVTKPLLLK